MRKLLLALAACALVFGAATLSAQSSTPGIAGDDVANTDTHDRPLGMVRITLPAPAGTPSAGGPPPVVPPAVPLPPPPENEEVPPTEPPIDPPPPEEPTTFFGSQAQGKIAFMLDASGSMAGSRIATVRAESTSTISGLTLSDEFEVMAYGSQFHNNTKFMWGGAIRKANHGHKTAAIAWINGPNLNPGDWTPSYAALQQAISIYPADLDKLFFLTDGAPNVTGGASAILADFPGWWTKMIHCDLVCICIGGVASAQTFMQQLASLAGGTYIAA